MQRFGVLGSKLKTHQTARKEVLSFHDRSLGMDFAAFLTCLVVFFSNVGVVGAQSTIFFNGFYLIPVLLV